MCELSEWNNDSDVGQQRKLTMQNGTDFGGSIVIKGVPVRRDSGTLRLLKTFDDSDYFFTAVAPLSAELD